MGCVAVQARRTLIVIVFVVVVEVVDVCVVVDVGTARQLQALESTALARVANLGGRPVILVVDDDLEVVVEDLEAVADVPSVLVVLPEVVLVVEVVLDEAPALLYGCSGRALFVGFLPTHVVIVVVLDLILEATI